MTSVPYPNGQFPASALAPIPGGQLWKPAAAAWNAMSAESVRRYGIELRAGGPDSSYREYDRQVYWRNYWCGRGDCGSAADPGTSNHGLAIAVDCPDAQQQAIINAIGAKYGWQKKWSDASWEPWHFTWSSENATWSGSDPGPGGDRYPVLRQGDGNRDAIIRAQKHLRRWNIGLTRPSAADGDFGPVTRKAVVAFQTVHGMEPDGIIGKGTWAKLREVDPLPEMERKHVNVIRWQRRTPALKVKNAGTISYHFKWIDSRLKSMAEAGRARENGAKRKAYWSKENRLKRRDILRSTIGRK